MPKIFENIVASEPLSLFGNIIIDKQHDSATGRFAATNLLLYQDFINSHMKESSQTYRIINATLRLAIGSAFV
ncbi:hypothetical protein ACFW04_009386 [Cataglyphis niger]